MIKGRARFLWLSLLLIAVAIQADDQKMVFSDPLKTIIVKKSESTFSIILQSNPTTGYSWLLKGYDANLIKPVRHKFYPPENKRLVGAPGYEKWTFQVKAEGFVVPQLTSITLIYLRPWEEQGAKAVNFKVVTNNAD